MAKRKKLTALGGDVFAGLFTLGVRRAGFEVLGHLEHTTYGTKSAQLNFPELDIRNGVANWHPEEFAGRVDFMYTNPPCAAWSIANGCQAHQWRDQTDRLQIVTNLVTAGLVTQPRAWCWESVLGAWHHGHSFVLEQTERWMTHGYHVTVLLQNNMYVGGTQNRQRVFVIAHRHPLVWPPFTRPPTVGELLRGLPRLPKRGRPRPTRAPPESFVPLHAEAVRRGIGVMRRVYDAGVVRLPPDHRKPGFYVRVLHPDKTPPVFMGAERTMHPRQPRFVNWYESLALCGLPLDWKTGAADTEQASLELSRAVMPGVGEWLARAVAAGLDRPPLDRRQPRAQLLDVRDPEQVRTEHLLSLEASPAQPPEVWVPVEPPKVATRGSNQFKRYREKQDG